MSILELGSLQLTLFAMMLIGALYTSIFLIPMRIVMWSVGTTYFVAGETVEKKKLIKNVLTHPCLVAIYLGLLCMVTQAQLPSVVLNTVKYIGNCNSALTMFIVGTILTDVPLKSIFSRDTVKFSVLRLVLLPAAALGKMKTALTGGGAVVGASVLPAALGVKLTASCGLEVRPVWEYPVQDGETLRVTQVYETQYSSSGKQLLLT